MRREKHRCERETWISGLLYMPQPGIEPVTIWRRGQPSNQPTTCLDSCTEFLKTFSTAPFLMKLFCSKGRIKTFSFIPFILQTGKLRLDWIKFLPGLRLICMNIIIINKPVSHYVLPWFQGSHPQALISYSLPLNFLSLPQEVGFSSRKMFFLVHL